MAPDPRTTGGPAGGHALAGVVLSVPGDRPDLFAKAARSGAGTLVLDLEDAVVPQRKDDARDAVAAWLAQAPAQPALVVRVNAVGSPWCHLDVAAVAAATTGPRTVMLPKTESADDLAFLDRLLAGAEARAGGAPDAAPTSTIALVESARGLSSLDVVAGCSPRLVALALGYADLAASLGRRSDLPAAAWAPVRDAVLVAARAHGLTAVDGPHLGTGLDAAFAASAAAAAAAGFDAKWVIHPRQVASAAAALAPDEEALAQAREVLQALDRAAASGSGVVDAGGLMVDEAVAAAARRLLARAAATPPEPPEARER